MKLALALVLAAAVALPVAAPAQTASAERSFSTGRTRVLQLDAAGGDVTLMPDGAAGSVRIRIFQSGAASGTPQIAGTAHGNRLAVTIGSPNGSSMIPFAEASATTFTVDYPAAMRLDVRASTGNVRIVKPQAAVEVFAQAGNVTIDAPAGPVTAEAAEGNVVATGASSTVDIASDGGDVSAVLAPGWSGAEVRLQSTKGAVSLTVAPGFRGRFDVTSGTGTVHNEFGKSNARSPLVWLYAPAGDVSIALSH